MRFGFQMPTARQPRKLFANSGSFTLSGQNATLAVKMPAAQGSFALTGQSATLIGFDPAIMSLTGWWTAPYSGSPWIGASSAGTSGSNNASHATLAPAVGASLNGRNTADFELGSTNFLSTNTMATFFTAGAGSAWALIKTESVRADQSNSYDESAIIMNTGQSLVLSVSTSGLRAGLHDGAWKFTSYQALSVATWALAQIRWNSTNLESRVNSGAWQTVAAGAIAGAMGSFELGRNSVNAAGYYDGLVAEYGTINSHLSDAQFDQIKRYINDRYNLSL